MPVSSKRILGSDQVTPLSSETRRQTWAVRWLWGSLEVYSSQTGPSGDWNRTGFCSERSGSSDMTMGSDHSPVWALMRLRTMQVSGLPSPLPANQEQRISWLCNSSRLAAWQVSNIFGRNIAMRVSPRCSIFRVTGSFSADIAAHILSLVQINYTIMHQPLIAPIITPLTKYFCRKG